MKRIGFIIICFFIYSYSFSQIDTTFTLVPNWKKGEIKKYQIERYSGVVAEGAEKTNDRTSKSVIIEVVDINDKFLELTWKTEHVNFIDTVESGNPFSKLMNSLDRDVSVRYTINRNGAIVSLLNLDEISKTVKSRVDTVLKEFINKNNIEKSDADLLNIQLSTMLASDEQIKSIVLHDLYKFHQLYGYSFTTNQSISIPDDIFAPNSNGQPSNNLELKCSYVDNRNKFYLIEGELKSASTDKWFREFIEKDRIIKNTYKFNYPGNWLISHTSVMNVGGEFMNLNTTYKINLAN